MVDLYQIDFKATLSEEEKQHSKAFLAMHLPVPVSHETFLLSRRLRWKAMHRRARRCLRANQDFGVVRLGDRNWRDIAGKRSFLNAYHLEIVGIPTARGLATADVRKGAGARQSYFAMEDLGDAAHLLDWEGDRHTMIHATARLIACLHNEAFSHRDLKATNILLDPDGTAYLIDLDGLDFKGVLPSIKLVASDLHRLYHDGEKHLAAKPAEKRAFLRTYWRVRHVKPRGLKCQLRTWRPVQAARSHS